MFLSALVNSLPLPFEQAVAKIADLGFTHVDVVGLAERPDSHREALAETPLVVSCAAVGRDIPHALDAIALDQRRSAVAAVKRQMDDAATLGATHCYLTSGSDATTDGLRFFTDACRLLADHAAQRMLRLCVEHIPGKALATAAAVLDWLTLSAHPNLYLLLDMGHCQITRELPAKMVEQAGPRLGYVHLDDNDGQADVHWPLLSGVLRERDLANMLRALEEHRYTGALCLELNARLEQPEDSLRRGRALVRSLLQ